MSVGHDNLWQLGHSATISFFGTPGDLNQTKVWSASYVAPIGTLGLIPIEYSSDNAPSRSQAKMSSENKWLLRRTLHQETFRTLAPWCRPRRRQMR